MAAYCLVLDTNVVHQYFCLCCLWQSTDNLCGSLCCPIRKTCMHSELWRCVCCAPYNLISLCTRAQHTHRRIFTYGMQQGWVVNSVHQQTLLSNFSRAEVKGALPVCQEANFLHCYTNARENLSMSTKAICKLLHICSTWLKKQSVNA